ncbi:MAG TPA: hypothetical protein VKY85_01210 [Candidatus Angelobacter sp.]|nr:hypothetical protein [Candidatus Angelobacter sp.]
MSVNRQISLAPNQGGIITITYNLYFLGVYQDKGKGFNNFGDLFDLTAAVNPGDQSLINAIFEADVFPSRLPVGWGENGGDMGGPYIEIVRGSLLTNWGIRFYLAGGAELGNGVAYPNLGVLGGTPNAAAASSVQVFFEWPQGQF